jgi:hypothetical protein
MERRSSPRRARRGTTLLIAAALAGGALAACGDDGPDTTPAATGGPGAEATATSSTTATTAACSFSGATAEAEGNQEDAFTRLLTDVRVGAHGCYDRVTFEFKPQAGEAAGPVGWHVAYEEPPITEDGSGQTVAVKGAAFLVVRFSAAGADLSQEGAPSTYTGPESLESADTPRIRQVRRIGDFEGVLTWVLGLDRRRPFSVTPQDDPMRISVDVGD